ncbi:hypothetical protein KL933_004938 [Ogataea haglerorum]|uniref:Uncharacterized protein n=1 Tax=Ogataea haglerorum TaxID=1937702 RepID=A0AAN6D144_9ASCO|nr:hypothetical protein KL933_004938 [Ogataea haglerorum]
MHRLLLSLLAGRHEAAKDVPAGAGEARRRRQSPARGVSGRQKYGNVPNKSVDLPVAQRDNGDVYEQNENEAEAGQFQVVVHCEFHRGACFYADHERAEANSEQNVEQRRAEAGVQARERESEGRERAVGDEVTDRVAHGEHRQPQHGLVDAVDGAGVFQDVDDFRRGSRDEVEHVDEADERGNRREQAAVNGVA